MLANSSGMPVWHWDQQEPFGTTPADENPSGLGAFEFPLRDEGTYFDKETALVYNWNRYRDVNGGRFLQADPLGLRGGDLSLYVLRANNPLIYTDPMGLLIGKHHQDITHEAMMKTCPKQASSVANQSVLADWPLWGDTQKPKFAYRHAMRAPHQSIEDATKAYEGYIEEQMRSCTLKGLGRALHAAQDSFAVGHTGFQVWSGGMPSKEHRQGDMSPDDSVKQQAVAASIALIERYKKMCPCECN